MNKIHDRNRRRYFRRRAVLKSVCAFVVVLGFIITASEPTGAAGGILPIIIKSLIGLALMFGGGYGLLRVMKSERTRKLTKRAQRELLQYVQSTDWKPYITVRKDKKQ